MIQHVSVEVKESGVEECVEFYRLLGFDPVDAPEGIAERAVWVQSGEVQVHLMFADQPQVLERAHFALVVDDYEETFTALETCGHDPQKRKQYWGSPRAFVRDPAGNLIELMAFAP